MAVKVYDVAVKTGEYMANGERKGRWQNVGAVMQGDDGSKFLMLAKWFNPAGVPDLSGNGAKLESILLSLFEPRQQNSQPQQSPQSQARNSRADSWAADGRRIDDEIPF